MKESKLYLHFFKSYLVYFFILSCFFSMIGGMIQYQKLPQFELIRILQITETGSVQDQVAHVQETVSLIRSLNVQQQLGVYSKLTLYNSSPLTITLQVISSNMDSTQIDSQKLTKYIQSLYAYSTMGNDINKVDSPNVWLGVLIGFFVGNILALVTLLIYKYFRTY